MEYNFKEIEQHWQQYWAEKQTFKVENYSEKPKYYVLDMFPYPSGAGLHVGHPLGYIASDIYTRYKRLKGFNVLHPSGYDSFGLPAEQYAIQTGQHPAITTETNINTYRKQLDKIGFSFDWSREVRTSDSSYYKWTQWIFIQLFNAWYNNSSNKAEKIETLITHFEKYGNTTLDAACDESVTSFSAEEWNNFNQIQQEKVLLQYRIAYLAETEVNWCPALGTVLANDEIVNGLSERGGHPVIRKKMTQWSMRISAYAERLLQGLEQLDWTDSLKESQRNWIGKSKGASIFFHVQNHNEKIEIFTTRPDTIFGVTFMTLSPEHELVQQITTPDYEKEVKHYIEETSKRSERDRISDVKTISGQFTGAYAIHPFTGEDIPIWIGDYVLASYGTGAVMSVPCGDERDYAFAKHFNISIKNIFADIDISEKAYTAKDGMIKIANSDFLDGLTVKKATKQVIYELEQQDFGKGKTNYRLRDAVFSRQRYWGEPFPVYYRDGIPQMIEAKHLPIVLPEVEKYLPTENGDPPLGHADTWAWDTENNTVVSNDKINHTSVFPLELNTMPGWAGSSWYFNRYMDTQNSEEFASQEALNYWKEVDVYIGGSEHATGHLLYSRFWQKFLFDLNYVPVEEFAKKLINQGMILGNSAFVYRVIPSYSIEGEIHVVPLQKPLFVTYNYYKEIQEKQDALPKGFTSINPEDLIQGDKYYEILQYLKKNNADIFKGNEPGFHLSKIHTDITFVNGNVLDIEKFKNWRPDFKDAEFILEEDGTYHVGFEVEKMSKSKYNVLNPDDICDEYGADSLRLYEMFLGPIDQAKPWNTNGLSGVYGFLKKFWKLFHSVGSFSITEEKPTKEEMKILHTTIKKIDEDIQNFSFNTSVSTFMIATNDLLKLKCNKRAILEPLVILLSPYAPHITEELWSKLGHKESISFGSFPIFEEKWLIESSKEYPISFNGKMRFKMSLPLDMSKNEME
ncbi:MAG: leucine--tRNA ligase, partial [Flavobacteriales bacterium]